MNTLNEWEAAELNPECNPGGPDTGGETRNLIHRKMFLEDIHRDIREGFDLEPL